MMAEGLFGEGVAPFDPKLVEVHEILLGYYGRPPERVVWDPLTQLIYSMLTSRTKEAESRQVMVDLGTGSSCGMRRWRRSRRRSGR